MRSIVLRGFPCFLFVDADHGRRFGRWYLAQRDPVWWRRNALIVLGNIGDPADARVRRTIEHYRGHADPILREHAEWAAERLAAHA